MQNKKSGLRNAAIFALVLLATLYGVFHGQDIGALRDALAQCRADRLIWAAGCVLLFILCDAENMWILLDSFGMGLSRWLCFLSSCVGFFFCAVTPSASGGQPMQVYYLRKKGIPVSVSSMALVVMAIAFKLTLVIPGVLLLVFGHGFLAEHLGGMMFLYYLGLLVTGGWTVFLILLMLRPRLARSILIWGMSVLEELHLLKNREERQTSLEVAMDLYRDTSEHIRRHPMLMLKVFAVALLRRCAILTVTWCVYWALGLSGTSWLTVVLLQAVISICADMLPVPGGMGASEGLFLKVYGPVFGSLALPGMLLSRGIGHYCQMLLCGLFTLPAILRLDRQTQESS